MRGILMAGLVSLLGANAFASEAVTTVTPLYALPGVSDGALPFAGLTLLGTTLYGTTNSGGAYGRGTVFSVDPATGAEKIVYSFHAVPDGNGSQSPLLAYKSFLYGVSNSGGASGAGVVYRINPATGAETVLFQIPASFAGGSGTNLVTDGTYLYGTTFGAGTAGQYGVIFKVNIKTGAGSSLYSFTGGTDGASPQTGIVLLNGIIYGTTTSGGANGAGTLFAVTATTGAETTLHAFNYATGAGAFGGLMSANGVLYGALAGGSGTNGVIYSYAPATGTYTTVATLTGSQGASPEAQLTYNKGVLYGTTSTGGANSFGTVFSATIATGKVRVLANFTGGAGGSNSLSGLVLYGGSLYGTTSGSGVTGIYDGTVFAVKLSSGTLTTLHDFTGPYNLRGTGVPVAIGGVLYGTAPASSASPYGALYSLNAATGTATTLYSFTGGADGGGPGGNLVASGNVVYGHTVIGGANGAGTLFSYNTATQKLAALTSFPAGAGGAGAAMAFATGTIYGATPSGGSGSGTLFSFDVASSTLKTVYTFSGSADGASPIGGVTLIGKTLYGTAEFGGANGLGTVFAVNAATGAETTLHSFAGGTDGYLPAIPPVLLGTTLIGGTVYGGSTTCFGGAGCGALYGYDIKTKSYMVLHAFELFPDGGLPEALLYEKAGVVYGGTVVGGATGGTLFTYSPAAGFATIYTFQNTNDGASPAGFVASGTGLYGTTTSGGVNGLGTLFSLSD
jgi:uncharacterized repeat protein (TIGR03803 family)